MMLSLITYIVIGKRGVFLNKAEFLSMPETDRKILMLFQKILPLAVLNSYLAAHWKIISKYTAHYPMFLVLDELTNSVSKMTSPGVEGKFKEKIKIKKQLIKATQKDLQGEIKPLVKMYNELKEVGEITEKVLNPIVEGERFKKAVYMGQKLSELWFIDDVYLFGSVAKGTEHKNSDIDLLINFSNKGVKQKIQGLLPKIVNDQNGIYHILSKTKNMDDIGFFEPKMLLRSNHTYPIHIGPVNCILEKKNIKSFLVDNLISDYDQYFVIEESNTGCKILLICDEVQVAIISVEYEQDKYAIFKFDVVNEQHFEEHAFLLINWNAHKIASRIKKMLNQTPNRTIEKVFKNYEHMENYIKVISAENDSVII